MKTSGNTILVTGGTAGIGRALAEQWHAAGNKVIVAGRNRAALEEMTAAHPGMAAAELDIADPASIEAFAARIVAEHPELNVLVNNAGIMHIEQDIPVSALDATVITNLLGPIRLTAALLPHLAARPGAALINVSSTLAFIPMPLSPVYSATKAALHAWSFALRVQLQPAGIEVIEIVPPAVRTGLMPGLPESTFAMPLDEFIAETMEILARQPTPREICVGRAQPWRDVTDDAKIGAILAQMGMQA